MASLKVHYGTPESSAYDIKDTNNSLATSMNRAKENKVVDLIKKYQAIMADLKATLWQNFSQSV